MSKKIFGTKEWDENSFNCINGCGHNCRYCYAAKIAVRYGRKENRQEWEKEILINKLDKIKKLTGRIMTPTTHDITFKNYDHVIKHLKKMLEVGNELLIVSKMHNEIADKISKDIIGFKNKIMFRISIGSTNEDALNYWEKNAPAFEKRFKSLKILSSAGYETSVSVEPMLWDDIDLLIDKCLPFCSHSIWIGKINNHSEPKNKFSVKLIDIYSPDNVIKIYQRYKLNPKIKWKDSFKKIIGLKLPKEKGLDI